MILFQVSGHPTVATGKRYNWVSAGEVHSCAVSTEGELVCWGLDRENYNRIKNTPTEGTWKMVSAGFYFSCAIQNNVEGVTCWGYEGYQGITDQPSEGEFYYVSTGVRTACALHANDNSVFCWGYANGYPNMITNGLNVYETSVLSPNDNCDNRKF
jgi:alpha-tubulin suppressor-like RCC1 family protein